MYYPPQTLIDAYPKPALLAKDVVRVQLDALQNNDLLPGDMGIRIAYRFASPVYRAVIGDLVRSIALVKNPLYAPLIGFDCAQFTHFNLTLTVDETWQEAWQDVWIVRRTDGQAGFRWYLSRQYDDDWGGCWLVDEVVRTE